MQATRSQALQLPPTTDVKALMAANYGKYDIALDPLWNGEYEQEAALFSEDEIAFYQCDQLGAPQELTDCDGKVAWSAQYKAWGQAKQAISDAACRAGMWNPIRFQGQYEDAETGLFYNRYRYYDPSTARFLSQDPIGLDGGANLYQYAPNPTAWIDPLGLARCGSAAATLKRLKGMNISRIEQAIANEGFSKTKDNGKNATWIHADGSQIRIHKYGDQSNVDKNGNLKKKSGLNAHVHKEDPCGNPLDDYGLVNMNKDDNHIGIKNPKDYTTVRGRPHGSGS
ncbi:RHS repeat domain-containing protein [Pseudoduganella armeniaca]|nr:RHS repeat-associated core domain-containing protein [Pseudoduganella armeniaca]